MFQPQVDVSKADFCLHEQLLEKERKKVVLEPSLLSFSSAAVKHSRVHQMLCIH